MNNPPQILIVDDEPNNFDVIDGLLSQENYNLFYASNGFNTLKRLETWQPELILLDVMMPELNGREVCKKIKENPQFKHIPIIMVTALNYTEELANCLKIGADDFIGKPVNGTELKARVSSMLRIKQQYDILAANLKMREDLSNMIVHDLRNPLTTIILASEYLKLTSLQEKQEEKVNQIGIAAQRLESLTNDLLILAKAAEAGKITLKCELVELDKLVEKVVEDFEAIACQQNIKLVTQLARGKPLFLDANLFRRVIENLLSNALKFAPSNSEITVIVNYPNNQLVQIQVIDQGVGVSEEFKKSIFEKYEVGEIKKGTKQTGLGLTFCKMVVEAHHGEIFVEDNHPEGAIFIINL